MPKSRQHRSSKKQRKSRPRRLRGGNPQVAGAPVVAGYVPQHVANLTPVSGGSVVGYVHPHVANLTPVVAGGSVAGYVPSNVGGLTSFAGGRRKKRGGAALLDDIAIPALFLTANQIYGSRRSRNTKKRTRFSRKVR